MISITHLILYFAIYSFCGWLWELIFYRVVHHTWHWHGFLTIPFLPIYGFAALGILILVQPYIPNPFLVFVASALIVSLLELVTGYVLNKAFHIRLWTYADLPFNIDGYTSLYTSLGFGLMGQFLAYVVQPWLADGVNGLPAATASILAWSFVVVFVLDFANSLAGLVRVRINAAKSNGTFDGIQKHLASMRSKLHAPDQGFKRFLNSWEQWNVNHLRRAFPGATIIRGKK